MVDGIDLLVINYHIYDLLLPVFKIYYWSNGREKGKAEDQMGLYRRVKCRFLGHRWTEFARLGRLCTRCGLLEADNKLNLMLLKKAILKFVKEERDAIHREEPEA